METSDHLTVADVRKAVEHLKKVSIKPYKGMLWFGRTPFGSWSISDDGFHGSEESRQWLLDTANDIPT